MATQTSRYHGFKRTGQLSLTTALATTPEIPWSEFFTGTIYIPAGSTITSLKFYGSPVQTGELDPLTPAASAQPSLTFYQLFSAGGSQVTLSVAAGNCYDLGALGLGGFGSLKIVADNAGTVEISKKS